VYVWEPVPRVLVTRVVGVLTVEGASAIEIAARRVSSRHGRLHAFHDWEPMTDYESAARNSLTQSALEMLKNTETLHILTLSKMVTLGVQAVSLVVRRIQLHTTRTSFESELRKALLERRV